MTIGIVEKVGVGVLLFAPSGRILVMKELVSKPSIGKEAGMISFPLETMRPGESREDTVVRLLFEEIGRSDLRITPIFFGGEMHIVSNAVTLACFALLLEGEFEVFPQDNDVIFHEWMYPADLKKYVPIRKEVIPVLEAFKNHG